jgi:uncharacterized protein with HEPN domain
MRPEAKKFLYDIQQATERVTEFCSGKDFATYANDPMLRSAVERQFEVIGEALRQLSAKDPATANRITGFHQVISFRNILIHGYAQIDDSIVWDIVGTKLPLLAREVRSLLEDD